MSNKLHTLPDYARWLIWSFVFSIVLVAFVTFCVFDASASTECQTAQPMIDYCEDTGVCNYHNDPTYCINGSYPGGCTNDTYCQKYDNEEDCNTSDNYGNGNFCQWVASTSTATSTTTATTFLTEQYILLGVSMIVFILFGTVGYMASCRTPQS